LKHHHTYKLIKDWLCCLLTLFILSLLQLSLHAQDEASIQPIIKENDLKKLDKSRAYMTEADALINEAQQIDIDVLTIQADPELDEKTIGKKTKKLEDMAQQKRVSASALYEKGNEIKFALYKKYIDEFWNTHAGEETNYLHSKLLEEQASDNYFQAVSNRIEAKKMDEGYAKIEKLTEANDLEMQAIQKQLTALCTYYKIGTGLSEEAIPVDQQISTLPDSIFIDPVEEINEPIVIQDIAAYNADTKSQGEKQAEFKTGDGLLFRIQVATSKEHLTVRQLKMICPANYPIEIVNEDDRLAYQLLGVTLYSDALQLMQHIGINGAFIIAYDKGQKIDLAAAVDINKELESNVKTMGREILQEYSYYLQLAASRIEIPENELKELYPGTEPVLVFYEDGWFKYRLDAGISSETAEQFRQTCGISGAFIIKYIRAAKIVYSGPSLDH
jgi:hypothetical protein